MKKVYYLSSCDTCRRILKLADVDNSFVLQDVKTKPITASQIEELKNRVGSFEALLNKRARKLKDVLATVAIRHDDDFKDVLLMDYTFLKRPVFVFDDAVFIGNSKSTVSELHEYLKASK